MYENAFDGKDVQVFNIKLKEPCKSMQNPKHHVTEKNEDEHVQQTCVLCITRYLVGNYLTFREGNEKTWIYERKPIHLNFTCWY